MVTIISTHPVNVRYNLWSENAEMHSKERIWDCTIPGGSGVLDNRSLRTPSGIATEITDDALEKLMQIPAFNKDIENGFIKVLKKTKARSVDADEEAEKDMNLSGSGRQLTDKDLEADGAEINEDGSINVTKGGKNAVPDMARSRGRKPSKRK